MIKARRIYITREASSPLTLEDGVHILRERVFNRAKGPEDNVRSLW
jgi:hypothetical protein